MKDLNGGVTTLTSTVVNEKEEYADEEVEYSEYETEEEIEVEIDENGKITYEGGVVNVGKIIVDSHQSSKNASNSIRIVSDDFNVKKESNGIVGDEITIEDQQVEGRNHEEESQQKKQRKKSRREEGKSNHRKKHHSSKQSHSSTNDPNSTLTVEGGDASKRIHVRSKDPLKIARQLEKALNGEGKKRRKGKNGFQPKEIKIEKICRICDQEPYVVERLVAEKRWWHKDCFRCCTCSKLLTLDTYLSHEGIIYCKLHHKELFLPKAIRDDIFNLDDKNVNINQAAVALHEEQQRRMETIVRENQPIDLGDSVVKSTSYSTNKYAGLENLDVGSKFKMFENADEVATGDEDEEEEDVSDLSDEIGIRKYKNLSKKLGGSENNLEDDSSSFGGQDSSTRPSSTSSRGPISDRYGIMDKLRRLKEGENMEDLLAEIDDEMPKKTSSSKGGSVGSESGEDDEHIKSVGENGEGKKIDFLENVDRQRRRRKREMERRRQMKMKKDKVVPGKHDDTVDKIDDLLNASANRIKKTVIDVKSENAKKFAEMFEKGEVPDSTNSNSTTEKLMQEKEMELETMKKSRQEQKAFFKRLESGHYFDDFSSSNEAKQQKVIGTFRKKQEDDDEQSETATDNQIDMEESKYRDESIIPELTSLSKRFSFFENYQKDEQKKDLRDQDHVTNGGGEDGTIGKSNINVSSSGLKQDSTTYDPCRKECKARSVLNKFKEWESRVLNGEDLYSDRKDDDEERGRSVGRLNKKYLVNHGSDEDSCSSQSYTDSEDSFTDNDSDDTESEYSESDGSSIKDATLREMKTAARSKQLRSKFEDWEKSQDCRDQIKQMVAVDENGRSLETATNLRSKFEALKMFQEKQQQPTSTSSPPQQQQVVNKQTFTPKRFKVFGLLSTQ